MMKKLKEICIPAILWLIFVSESVRFGMAIGAMKIEPQDTMPLWFMAIVCGLSFFLTFCLAIVNCLRKKMGFELFLEKVLTAKSYDIIARRTKPFLLGFVFFALGGAVEIIRSFLVHSPDINRQVLTVVIFFGSGILIGWLVSLPIMARRSFRKFTKNAH